MIAFSRSRGGRYLGNTNKKEVHDTSNEKTSCQVETFLARGHGVRFVPDLLSEAIGNGYDRCYYCLGGSTR